MPSSPISKVFVQSFGCRASQADGAGLESAFAGEGVSAVADAAHADLIILNTCTVTATADGDARHAVRKLHRENPDARILVTGCYAQRAPEELAAIPGVTWVIGNSHKTAIAEIVLREDYHGQIHISDISGTRDFLASPVLDAYADRSRPTLKVQDGCSNKCSFCIIPSVRGRSRSAGVASVVQQVQELAARYPEIVLSGINLGRWGRDLDRDLRFADLLRTLLRETDVQRLRISSVEPMDWSGELLQLVAEEPRIAKHVHIPLQSASDTVLKRMYRKYRVRHYQSRIALARELMPDAAIGADVMTGFPGETEAEFEETRRFIEEQPFTYLHVFTYSERPGTEAAAARDQVPVHVRRERTHILRGLSDLKNRAFRERLRGRIVSAVPLGDRAALTTNFVPLELATLRTHNCVFDVKVGTLTASGLREVELLPVLA